MSGVNSSEVLKTGSETLEPNIALILVWRAAEVAMQIRKDHMLGFFGGKVEPEDGLPEDDKTAERAAVRELTQETNMAWLTIGHLRDKQIVKAGADIGAVFQVLPHTTFELKSNDGDLLWMQLPQLVQACANGEVLPLTTQYVKENF